MSRIRSIKPEWLEDERMALASDASRVLSIGLMLIADDYGRGRAALSLLVGRVFPGKPLGHLEEALRGLTPWFVRLYEVDGQAYFEISNWARHQRVEKPGNPRVPPPRGSPGNFPGSLAPDQDPDPGPDPGRGRGPDPDPGPPRGLAKPAPNSRPWRRVPDDWDIKPDQRALALQLIVDVELEAQKFRDHEFRSPKRDADATFRNWIREAANRPRGIALRAVNNSEQSRILQRAAQIQRGTK